MSFPLRLCTSAPRLQAGRRKRTNTISMTRDLHEPYRTHLIQAQDDLSIPAGEFVALFISALLTLSLLFGPPTFASVRKNGMLAFSAPAPLLKRWNAQGRNEYSAQRANVRSAKHSPSVDKMTSVAEPVNTNSNNAAERKSSAMQHAQPLS
jgi:hypothetical protein